MIQRVNMREYSMYLDSVQTLFLVVAFLYDTTVHGEVNIMGLQYAPNIKEFCNRGHGLSAAI